MKIVSYNVNGIRAAIKKGFIDWLKQESIDIVGIQETKAQKSQVEMIALHELGYRDYWHSAQKKGYSGVSILSKIEPEKVLHGMGVDKYDNEGRVISAFYKDFILVNGYFPSGTSGELRQEVKYSFLKDFYDWIKILESENKPIIVLGDYNIAHTEMDIHNPKSNKNTSGFLPEERAWMSKWFGSGYTDSYRYVHPDEETYSWWSYRANARTNNKGWRIDYVSVSDALKTRITDARQLTEVVHSDHCPVLLDIDVQS